MSLTSVAQAFRPASARREAALNGCATRGELWFERSPWASTAYLTSSDMSLTSVAQAFRPASARPEAALKGCATRGELWFERSPWRVDDDARRRAVGVELAVAIGDPAFGRRRATSD